MKFKLESLDYIINIEVNKYGNIMLELDGNIIGLENDEVNILATLSNNERAKYISEEFKIKENK